MLDFIRHWLGREAADAVGPPTGKTGNQWTEEDFSGSTSALALKGGPEFVEFCINAGTCGLEGEVLQTLQEILDRYPVSDSDDYDHFAVLVRTRLIKAGLLPEGDPQRYQYRVTHLAMALSQPDRGGSAGE